MDDDLHLYVPYQEPEYDSTMQRAAATTLEQVRHAERLRLQIRESFLRRPEPPATVWMVHVD